MHTIFASIARKMILGVGAICIVACASDVTPTTPEPAVQTTFTKKELDKLNVYIIAGDYYEMKIGVKGNQLTGVYQLPNSKPNDPCVFFFQGKIGTQNPIEVTCYNPKYPKQTFTGTFKVLGDALIAKLSQLPEEGCEPQFIDEIGRSMVLDLSHEWSEIRIIQHGTTLWDQPSETISVSEQLNGGSVVAIKEKKGNWFKVEVLNGTKEEGWIQDYVLYPLLDL